MSRAADERPSGGEEAMSTGALVDELARREWAKAAEEDPAGVRAAL